MRDFEKRASGMSRLNLWVGIAGAVVAFAMFPGNWASSLLAFLGGGLIGVALEKRYLDQMRSILLKLWRVYQDTGRSRSG